jgi:hypothetical protein
MRKYDSLNLAEGRGQWQNFVNMLIKLKVHKRREI